MDGGQLTGLGGWGVDWVGFWDYNAPGLARYPQRTGRCSHRHSPGGWDGGGIIKVDNSNCQLLKPQRCTEIKYQQLLSRYDVNGT